MSGPAPRLHDLNRPGRQVLRLIANPASEQLLTIDAPGSRQSKPSTLRRGTSPHHAGMKRRFAETRSEVLLWDLNRLEEPPVVLGSDQF